MSEIRIDLFSGRQVIVGTRVMKRNVKDFIKPPMPEEAALLLKNTDITNAGTVFNSKLRTVPNSPNAE